MQRCRKIAFPWRDTQSFANKPFDYRAIVAQFHIYCVNEEHYTKRG
jgi:hypothetical protein